jgi:hypothetical protein
VNGRLNVFVIMLAIAFAGSAALAVLAAPFLWAASRLPFKFRRQSSRALSRLALKCLVSGSVFTACMSTLVGTPFTEAGVWLGVMPGTLIFVVTPTAVLNRLPEASLFVIGLTFSSLFWALLVFAAVRVVQRLSAKAAVA